MTLQGKARVWFNSLAPASISSFAELEHCLRNRFLQRKKFESTVVDLMAARQESNEGLRQYLERFNELSLQVEGRTDQMVISAFINSLKPGYLHKDLLVNPPVLVQELIDRVHQFSKAEEADRKKRDLEPKGQLKKQKDFSKSGNTFQHSKSQNRTMFDRISRVPGRSDKPDSRTDSANTQSRFTPLNKPRAEILAIVASEGSCVVLTRCSPHLRNGTRICIVGFMMTTVTTLNIASSLRKKSKWHLKKATSQSLSKPALERTIREIQTLFQLLKITKLYANFFASSQELKALQTLVFEPSPMMDLIYLFRTSPHYCPFRRCCRLITFETMVRGSPTQ